MHALGALGLTKVLISACENGLRPIGAEMLAVEVARVPPSMGAYGYARRAANMVDKTYHWVELSLEGAKVLGTTNICCFLQG